MNKLEKMSASLNTRYAISESSEDYDASLTWNTSENGFEVMLTTARKCYVYTPCLGYVPITKRALKEAVAGHIHSSNAYTLDCFMDGGNLFYN